jgi:hypothetical protein
MSSYTGHNHSPGGNSVTPTVLVSTSVAFLLLQLKTAGRV